MRKSKNGIINSIANVAVGSSIENDIKKGQYEYGRIKNNGDLFVKSANDLAIADEDIEQYANVKYMLASMIIFAFAVGKKVNPMASEALINSLHSDFCDIKGSGLAYQIRSVSEASIAYKEVIKMNNFALANQQASRMHLAYNEFIDKLLPYIIMCVNESENNRDIKKLFNSAFNTKLEILTKILGKQNEYIEFLNDIANVKLRNAIAHGKIMVDVENKVIRYIGNNEELAMGTDVYVIKAGYGIYIQKGYLLAISIICACSMGPIYIVKLCDKCKELAFSLLKY